MLSLKELRRAASILEKKLAGTSLQRAVQTDEYRLNLAFRSREAEAVVHLSCRPEFARIATLARLPKAPAAPLSFAQYMRSHLIRASFGGISTAKMDRQVTIRLLTTEGPFELLLSILGPRSNVYLLNSEGNLVQALRRLEETRRELILGGPWVNPEGILRSEGVDRWDSVPDEGYFEVIERSYGSLERTKEVESLARKIESALSKEQDFLDRKALNLQQDLGEARQADGHRRKGELLKSVLHRIRPGDTVATATDYETGETVSIPLDAALSPAQNLEAYFGLYQKELRGVAAIEEQLEAVRNSQSVFERMRTELRGILSVAEPEPEALVGFAAKPQLRRLLGRFHTGPRPAPPVKSPGGKNAVPARLMPKRYRTRDGLEVWVGRNDESNDYLTTRLARGNDLFFHLEGYPGSHVILRTEGRTDPPSDSMLAACELAVHFSKLKDTGRADVHVAYTKDVRKPKGVKKGLVYVTHGKTIHLRRDPKRLEDILASRLDE